MNTISLANVPPTPRLDEYFGLWAVEDVRFGAMFDRVSRMNLQIHVQQSPTPKLESKMITTPSGTSQDSGQVAIVPISGTIMKQVGSLSDGTSSVAARMALRAAASDPNISAILLLVDSPGGTVSGTADLATEVTNARKSKPVYAYVEDLAASAAYWVASSADKVFANNPTAIVGSIGTYVGLYDLSGLAGQQGIKAKLYKTGPLKGAGFPGTEITAEQDAAFQKMVDETQSHFTAAVQANRKLSPDQMKAVTTGGVFLAAEAQSLGLIDGIKSFDETLAALEAVGMKKKPTGARAAAEVVPTNKEIAMSDTPTPSAPATPVAATLKELKTALPKSSAEFREKCLEDGVTTQQAMARFIEQQDAALEQAKQSSKKIGTDPVGGGSGKPAKAEEGVVDFKSLVNAKVQAGTPRAQAWAEAARENPEAHEAYVLQHNAKHGRRHAEMPGAYSR